MSTPVYGSRKYVLTEFGLLDKIAIEIVHGKHSEFLKKFADAWLDADQQNKRILQPAFLKLIDAHDLEGAH